MDCFPLFISLHPVGLFWLMNGERRGTRETQPLLLLHEWKANEGKRFSHQLQLVSAMSKRGQDTKLENLRAWALKSDGPEFESHLCHQSSWVSLEIHVTSWLLWNGTELSLYFPNQEGKRERPHGKHLAQSIEKILIGEVSLLYLSLPLLSVATSASSQLLSLLSHMLSTLRDPTGLTLNPSKEGGTSPSLHCAFITINSQTVKCPDDVKCHMIQ